MKTSFIVLSCIMLYSMSSFADLDKVSDRVGAIKDTVNLALYLADKQIGVSQGIEFVGFVKSTGVIEKAQGYWDADAKKYIPDPLSKGGIQVSGTISSIKLLSGKLGSDTISFTIPLSSFPRSESEQAKAYSPFYSKDGALAYIVIDELHSTQLEEFPNKTFRILDGSMPDIQEAYNDLNQKPSIGNIPDLKTLTFTAIIAVARIAKGNSKLTGAIDVDEILNSSEPTMTSVVGFLLGSVGSDESRRQATNWLVREASKQDASDSRLEGILYAIIALTSNGNITDEEFREIKETIKRVAAKGSDYPLTNAVLLTVET